MPGAFSQEFSPLRRGCENKETYTLLQLRPRKPLHFPSAEPIFVTASGSSRQASHRGALRPNPSRFFLVGAKSGTFMHLCYIDESGTPDVPGNTSHFVLTGLSVPIRRWKEADQDISAIRTSFRLSGVEIHTAWMTRVYPEQRSIANFEQLADEERRRMVEQYRARELLRLQRSGKSKLYHQTKKNYKHSAAYVHLTHKERLDFLRAVADRVSQWSYARLFADCIDKVHYNARNERFSIDEEAFHQIVTRFEFYLTNTRDRSSADPNYALLIHDNNPTSAHKHTELMKRFHQQGTLWRQISNIIETPLFVDSRLTSMVQIADLCAFSLRRYVENAESDLFDRVIKIADRNSRGVVVGVRHFTSLACQCKICVAHRQR